MDAPKLTLIKGTRDEHLSDIYRFVAAEVTDTRLMGVLGLHIHWLVSEAGQQQHMHQFFYYDVVELGLDFVASLYGDNGEAVSRELKQDFGGLGASMVPLSESEARYLARFFVEDTQKRFGTLPPDARNLEYITRVPAELGPEALKALWDKICVRRFTVFGTINYFLMRAFSHDFEAAEYLLADGAEKSLAMAVRCPEIGELLRNSVSVSNDGEVPLYLCESLVETDNGYTLVFSEIRCSEAGVSTAKVNSVMPISRDEAAMKLMREEYLDVFDFEFPGSNFDDEFDEMTLGATETLYSEGAMYMQFKADNSHVEKPLYRLNDDVEALYFLCRPDDVEPQLVVSAFSYEAIKKAEARVMRSLRYENEPILTGKFHFDESLIFEFANSGYDDFMTYLGSLDLQGE